MTKTYLATKTEVQLVSDDVATINTQINTPTTGLDARVQATEDFEDRIGSNEANIGSLDMQVNNPVYGLSKQVSDISTELDEAGTGVKARIADLEQGGTSVTKFRTHSPSGAYEDGEVVQVTTRDGFLFKANNAIDGSTTPVAFIEGTGVNRWTRVGRPSGAISAIESTNLSASKAVYTSSTGKLVASSLITSTQIEYLKDLDYNLKETIDSKQAKISFPVRTIFAATISSTGVVSSNYISSITCNKISDGLFEISGYAPIDVNYSTVLAESISDDDNIYCIHNRTNSSFRIKWYDMPNMTPQSLNFRLRVITF